MLVPMAKVRIIGHRGNLDATLALLHELHVLHLVDVNDDPGVRLPPLTVDDERLRLLDDLRYLRARVDALLALVQHPPQASGTASPLDAAALAELRGELDEAGPQIESLVGRLDELEAEQETLPRYAASLRRLLPLVPELTELEGYETAALMVDRRHAAVLGELNTGLAEALGANYEIISDQLDPETVGAVLVFPRNHAAAVSALLGREHLSRLRLPEQFERAPFRRAITNMDRRMTEIPIDIAATRAAIDDAVKPHGNWADASAWLRSRIEQLGAIRHLGATPHTFVVIGWVPERDLARLRHALTTVIGGAVVVEAARPEATDAPPVLMSNPAPARPFEFLVRLLALPQYGSLDPTRLMMIFLPLFFGMMLGDVAYGVVLGALAFVVHHRFRERSAVARDLSSVFMLAAAWSIVWGVVYAEFLGDLGRQWWGWEPLWINREDALQPLLLLAVTVGAVHITLGLLLGIWQSARGRRRNEMLERIATLTALGGLFLIAAVAADRLPSGVITPAVAAIVVALVVMASLEGAMGILMAPLELLGAVGNVLSYLRIAAIGLASVYLARVANELGATGPVWLGIVIAALFHALNLALGTFSPAIQALRLHYVEFFGTFYTEGGRPFTPFGAPNDGVGGAPPT